MKMLYQAILFSLLWSLSVQASGLPTLSDLSRFRWENRLVLIDNDKNHTETLTRLVQKNAEVNGRDILWFILHQDSVATNYSGKITSDFASQVRQIYRIGQSQMLLIGKDGGVKSRLDQVDLQAIFTEIDAMPMRRREMRD
jgi:hypothetical protein